MTGLTVGSEPGIVRVVLAMAGDAMRRCIHELSTRVARLAFWYFHMLTSQRISGQIVIEVGRADVFPVECGMAGDAVST